MVTIRVADLAGKGRLYTSRTAGGPVLLVDVYMPIGKTREAGRDEWGN